MKVLTAKVVDGRVVLPPGTADEGALVTLLVPEHNQEAFGLSRSEKAFLLESIEQANRGEVTDGWTLLEQLRPA